MKTERDLIALAGALNDLAKLYQFRSLDEQLYGALTVSQSYCLRILYFQGARSMSELAADLHLRLSTMTGVVDQLEGKGLVQRVDHPDDRRSLRVSLTPKGRKLYQAAHKAFLSYLEPLFDNRSRAERKAILSFLSEAAGAIRGWQENPRFRVQRHAKENS